MKILEICTVRFLLTGIPIHIRNYYNELKEKNRVDIVSSEYNANLLKTMRLQNGTKLYSFSRKKHPIQYLIQLRRLVTKENYDIIHIHGNSATMALELFACRGLKSVVIVHTHNVEYQANFFNKILSHYFLNKADLYFAASKSAGKKLYGDQKFTVITNGIDESRFKFNDKVREQIRNRLNIKKRDIVFGHVGYFGNQKNQIFILKLAKKFVKEPRVKFLLVGDGFSENFRAEIQNAGLGEKFIILPATSNVGDLYSAFDVFLFPSKFEGLGMVGVEAQLSGLPCLISNKVPREVKICDRVSFLPLSIDKWSQAMHSLMKNNIPLTNRTSVVSDRYDIKRCAKYLNRLYKRAWYKKNDNQKNIKMGL